MITIINELNDNDENNNIKTKLKTNLEITPLGYSESTRKKDGIHILDMKKIRMILI